MFAEFDHNPLAAASIAQVHTARLLSGADVVVKIQRPGIRPVVERDLDIVTNIVRSRQGRSHWMGRTGAADLAAGFNASIHEELDFRIEARNMAAVAIAAAGRDDASVRVPAVHEDLCTERVLVMERLVGEPLGSAGQLIDQLGVDRSALARRLLAYVLRQVMVDGVFHADPHPGNILVLEDGGLGLVDFGSVGRLDPTMRAALQSFLLAVDRGDSAGLSDALLDVVARPDEIDEQELQRALGRFLARHLSGGTTVDVEMFADLFRLVSDHGLPLPPEIAAVFRALATLEGTLAELAPGFDIISESRAFATAEFKAQIDPALLKQAATNELVTALPMLRRLPRRIDRITGALEQNRLGMRVRFFADERDRQFVTTLVQQILLTFLGATTGVMAVLLLATTGGPKATETVSLFHVFGYNLLVISTLLVLRVLFAIFRPRP